MFEGVGYQNQFKYFLYTTNPGPTLHLPDYSINPILLDKNFWMLNIRIYLIYMPQEAYAILVEDDMPMTRSKISFNWKLYDLSSDHLILIKNVIVR